MIDFNSPIREGRILDAKIPAGPVDQKWTKHKFDLKLVNPANKRKYKVLVVGTGLGGGSAAASLAELGYNVEAFCFQDSGRRAHSIAAQGGINSAKNYPNDGDSVFRLFYDTVKGGDFRAREANVHRLAEVSRNIIDQCVAQGVPFAREYGGYLDNRSFGGAQLSRTFYAKGQTGQQLLLGAYQSMMRQVGLGRIKLHTRSEMLDLVVVDGRARGIVTRDLVTGEINTHWADAVVLATGGYGNVYYVSTNAVGSNVTAAWRAHKRGAYMANPCYTQIHPTCIPVSGDHQSKLTLMSESLRNDGRVWVPRKKEDAEAIRTGKLSPQQVQEEDRYYVLEERYPSFGNLVPRDVASRNAMYVCEGDPAHKDDASYDEMLKGGRGVNETGQAVYLDFADAIQRYGKQEVNRLKLANPSAEKITELGEAVVRAKYGNLFQMYEQIVAQDPYKTPMTIYPAVHYTMGGLWVDYNLMSNVPGLFVLGEANFSDHGANRLGASALMQGLSDGYFVLPYTIGGYLAEMKPGGLKGDEAEFEAVKKQVKEHTERMLSVQGKTTVREFHKELGKIMWTHCGMARDEQGLKSAIEKISNLRKDFWSDVRVAGEPGGVNTNLEYAGRVADFLEFGELFAYDALVRDESCGGHFRIEHATEEGEAKRNDDKFAYAAAWEFTGDVKDPVNYPTPILNKDMLSFEAVHLTQRSYK